jgi:predicted N-acetyltransferase YhbS
VWVYSLFLFARADLNQELRALDDQTTKMILSLLAIENGKAIGHILFTKVQLESLQKLIYQSLARVMVGVIHPH